MESIKQSHPNDGERLMIGHLHRLGITVQRSRLRASIGKFIVRTKKFNQNFSYHRLHPEYTWLPELH